MIVANDVRPETGIMGGGDNAVVVVSSEGAETWPRMTKAEVARKLVQRIAALLDGQATEEPIKTAAEPAPAGGRRKRPPKPPSRTA